MSVQWTDDGPDSGARGSSCCPLGDRVCYGVIAFAYLYLGGHVAYAAAGRSCVYLFLGVSLGCFLIGLAMRRHIRNMR